LGKWSGAVDLRVGYGDWFAGLLQSETRVQSSVSSKEQNKVRSYVEIFFTQAAEASRNVEGLDIQVDVEATSS